MSRHAYDPAPQNPEEGHGRQVNEGETLEGCCPTVYRSA